MVDATGIGQSYWVFYGALTDLNYTLSASGKWRRGRPRPTTTPGSGPTVVREVRHLRLRARRPWPSRPPGPARFASQARGGRRHAAAHRRAPFRHLAVTRRTRGRAPSGQGQVIASQRHLRDLQHPRDHAATRQPGGHRQDGGRLRDRPELLGVLRGADGLELHARRQGDRDHGQPRRYNDARIGDDRRAEVRHVRFPGFTPAPTATPTVRGADGDTDPDAHARPRAPSGP